MVIDVAFCFATDNLTRYITISVLSFFFCLAESNEVKFQLNLDIKTTFNFRPVRNCRIQVEFVTSLLTALRNWSGLMHLSKSILASDILRPRKTDYFCSNDYSHSAHVAKVLQVIITSRNIKTSCYYFSV